MGIVLAAWFIAALIAATSGILAQLPVPVPAIGWLLTASALITLWRSPAARAQTPALGPGALVAFHVIRLFAGANFLWLYERGELPDEFALVAGWGDIAVGIGALIVLALAIPVRTEGRRYALLAWNTFGLIDILVVLGNGTRMFLRDPQLGDAFLRLPLALLPTFYVPLVITTHIALFTWYARRSWASGRAG